ncbi:trehalase [Cokeromyces recurvatus]|uniref:trehalase n=1 Tax=Cokeromyces recurvatus TaxID=90255 RepID=UPI0022212065|nr:trehalase [Cokeromyces recurvatus]KAI7906848.1 trehalase [Cokeromyces recurvatus]
MYIHTNPFRLICGAILTHISIFSTVFAIQNHDSYSCDSPIYCDGPILQTVQLARIFEDSKTFVDMPTTKSESEILHSFQKFGGTNATREQVMQFLSENFLPAGSEVKLLKNISIPELSWIDKISNPEYHGWVSHLNQAWGNLSFTFDYSNLCEECLTSTLTVNRPFVVPGGRFREFYYWDSFFVIQGLLLSDQDELAKNMIENFFDFVKKYGFVPNGARIYYLNRSQPPFLTHMVQAYYEKTGDRDFMIEALPILEQEYAHWIKNASVQVKDPKSFKIYTLNHYVTSNTSPRPESYVEDFNTVNKGTHFTDAEKRQMYADIAAGAETGWDYSSRWTKQKVPSINQTASYEMLRTINTANIVPIDLNSLLWHTENKLSEWYKQFGNNRTRTGKRKSKYYKRQAKNRLAAIESLMWNEEEGSFYDFNLTSHAQNIQFTPATLFPIWVGALPERIARNKTTLAKLFDETERALLKYPGILTTSYYNTTMQWDWPNGWPPLTYIAIQSMLRIENYLNNDDTDNDNSQVTDSKNHTWTTSLGTPFVKLAQVLAERYAASAYCGWVNTGGSVPGILDKVNASIMDEGHMFEKFDVNTIGRSGSQGEYISQTGFGWTNGIALWIFNQWPNFIAPNCTKVITYDF